MSKYIYDLHIHTERSSLCGRVPAKEMIRLYMKKDIKELPLQTIITKTFSSCFKSVLERTNRFFPYKDIESQKMKRNSTIWMSFWGLNIVSYQIQMTF